MKYEIKIPNLGESISEAVIGNLLKLSGSFVKQDEEILEIETEKVNQVLVAPAAGILELHVKEGQKVAIGEVIGSVESKSASVQEKVMEEKISPEQEKIPEVPLPIPQKAPARKGKEEFLKEIQTPVKAVETLVAPTKAPIKETERETRKKMSSIRLTIAKRLVEAKQETAMLTTFNEIDMSSVIQAREKYKDLFQKNYGVKLGFMSFFVKAVVRALQLEPGLNSYIDGDDIVSRHYYDLGIAVSSDRGLVVPVLRNCDTLSFNDIEKAIADFGKRAREGKLSLAELQGGGFTITNGGVFGSLLSTPILNPPQSGILGMHKIEKRPVVINDLVSIRPMMYVALSYDHRIVDGKEAVSFLVHVKEVLEDPARLVLEI